MDIMHDRAGFYICWGFLAWVPRVCTSTTLYLVQHPIHLGTAVTSLLLILGASATLINYLADGQRQKVRATQGICTVWGKQPLLTKASYSTSRGEIKESILFASGWWGIARHFHCLPEILGALCWSLPGLFSNFLPYFYVAFLAALLIDPFVRDDKRCKEKYGSNWDLHCQKVRYKILPYVW